MPIGFGVCMGGERWRIEDIAQTAGEERFDDGGFHDCVATAMMDCWR